MSVVETLKQKAREWAKSVVDLHNMTVPAQLEPEKRALIASAKTVKTAIEKVFGTIEELKPMAQIYQLGVIPLAVPIVAVSAASAAIAKWYYEHKKLLAKVDSYNTLTSGGLSPAQAVAVIDGKSGGIVETAKKILIPAGLLVAAYMLIKNRA